MSSLKGKRLLVLGGSRISCEIVTKAQEMGIYTIVTDWYSVDKSPAKKIADKAFMISTADVKAVVQLIKDENIDGVITGFTDSTLVYYSQICKEAKLPCYGTKEQFEILTNKKVYKKLCRDYRVPVVDEFIVEGNFNTKEVEDIKYPVLVKPVDNSGARGISICENKQELIVGYKKALEFSQSKKVIVERYIEGKEVTVFYVLQDGEIYLTAMGNRHVKQNQDKAIALPVAYSFPSINLTKYQLIVEQRVSKMFKSIGMKNGMVFMQCLVENDECIVYDIGYRLTGSMEYKILEKLTGINPMEMMIKFAITGFMSNVSLSNYINPNFKSYACNITFLTKPGTIGKICGLSNVIEIEGVIDAVLNHVEGDIIPQSVVGTLQQVVLRVIAIANTKTQLSNIINKVHETFKVYSINGENMLLSTFNTEELKGDI